MFQERFNLELGQALRHSYLSSEEENELVCFIVRCAKIGYPKTEAIAIVQLIVESKGIHTTISNGWWERFIGRQWSPTKLCELWQPTLQLLIMTQSSKSFFNRREGRGKC